jgi:hypothetical protein
MRALIADIGGTNARFALTDTASTTPELLHARSLANADFASLQHAAAHYLADIDDKPVRAAIAVACPVGSDEIRLTNRAWSFSRAELQKRLGLDELRMINDFGAVAWAVPALDAQSRVTLHGDPNAAIRGPVTVIGPGTLLEVEPGNMIGPTRQGMDDLIDLDPDAKWDKTLNGGVGGIKGGCMSSVASPCAISPRLVAIPMFNPDAYQLADQGGRTTIQITKVLGFFVDKMQGNDVMGYLMTYPSDPSAGMGGVPGSGFVVSVALVR